MLLGIDQDFSIGQKDQEIEHLNQTLSSKERSFQDDDSLISEPLVIVDSSFMENQKSSNTSFVHSSYPLKYLYEFFMDSDDIWYR